MAAASALGAPSSDHVDENVIPTSKSTFGEGLTEVPYKNLNITIPSVTLIADEFAAYKIQIKCGEEKWTIFRRYSSCKSFHTELSRIAPVLLEILRFPKKKWFGNKSAHFVEKRRSQLELYFQMLLSSNLPRSKQLSESIMSFFATSDAIIKNNRLLDAVRSTR